jgi:hypothetical protein
MHNHGYQKRKKKVQESEKEATEAAPWNQFRSVSATPGQASAGHLCVFCTKRSRVVPPVSKM